MPTMNGRSSPRACGPSPSAALASAAGRRTLARLFLGSSALSMLIAFLLSVPFRCLLKRCRTRPLTRAAGSRFPAAAVLRVSGRRVACLPWRRLYRAVGVWSVCGWSATDRRRGAGRHPGQGWRRSTPRSAGGRRRRFVGNCSARAKDEPEAGAARPVGRFDAAAGGGARVAAGSLQVPPRRTRILPKDGPRGSICGSCG
jgi:hypothetical protein